MGYTLRNSQEWCAMTQNERNKLISQLGRSFYAIPDDLKHVTVQAMDDAENPFDSFIDVLEAAPDEYLVILRNEFAKKGYLLPEIILN